MNNQDNQDRQNDIKIANNYMLATLLCIIFIAPSIIKLFLNYTTSIWLLQILGSITYLTIPLLIFVHLGVVDLNIDIPLKKLSFKNIILIILISITMQPLLSFIASITNIFNEDVVSEVIFEFYKIPYWQSLLAVAVAPALIEEFIFRGIILSKYNKAGLFGSVLISSLYFGIIHLTISQLFYAIIGGIILGFLVKITDSIWAGILGHFVLNGTQITMAYISYNSLSNIYNTSNQVELDINTLNSLEDITNIYNIYDNIELIQAGLMGIFFIMTLPMFIFWIYLFIKNNHNQIINYKNNKIDVQINISEIFSISFYLIIIIYVIYMIL
ncbi:MAG: type II CAAX endopeptidase family protein [bacterium]